MICPQCQKEFEPINFLQKFCSRACRNIAEGKLPKKITTTAKAIKPPKKEQSGGVPLGTPMKKIDTCRNCGNQFKPSYRGEKFCSDRCRFQYFHLDFGSAAFNISI